MSEPIRIELWHTLGNVVGVQGRGFGDCLAELVAQFNRSQSDYVVVETFKGGYDDVLRASLNARNTGPDWPHIIQVPEAGVGALMTAARGMIKPAAEIIAETGEGREGQPYLPIVADHYTAPDGRLYGFPFNISTAILYYNKNAFARAGLDPERPPATWPELIEAAARLKASGTPYGYTTSRHVWVHLENFSTWHGVEFATRNNGFDGPDARLCFDSPAHVRHLENLSRWREQGLFTFAGRGVEVETLFIEGECPLITTASSAYAGIVLESAFEVGVAPLPYYPDIPGAPQNSIIGGSAFWATSGKSHAEYVGIARFMAFASRPEEQARRHREIGFLPVSTAAYELADNPAVRVSLHQFAPSRTTGRSRGIRLGSAMQIRPVIEREVESVWLGDADPKTALTRAVQLGNVRLEAFQRLCERGEVPWPELSAALWPARPGGPGGPGGHGPGHGPPRGPGHGPGHGQGPGPGRGTGMEHLAERPPRRRPADFEEHKAMMMGLPRARISRSFRPRPTDVFVATYPKCGTTWVQQIVHGLRTRGSMDFEEISTAVPWIESLPLQTADLNAPQVAEPRAFKSHLSADELPPGGRVIHVVRDPGDALVSAYHFHNGWLFERDAVGIEEFGFKCFVELPLSHNYWRHLRSWWHRGQREPMLMLCFEDMKQDHEGTVRRIAEFIGVPADEELIALATRQSTFEFMRAHERQFDDHIDTEWINRMLGLPADSRTTKVRAGRVGDSQSLSPELRAALDRAWEREIAGPLGISSYAELRELLRARAQR